MHEGRILRVLHGDLEAMAAFVRGHHEHAPDRVDVEAVEGNEESFAGDVEGLKDVLDGVRVLRLDRDQLGGDLIVTLDVPLHPLASTTISV